MKKNYFIYILSVCLAGFFTSCEKQANQTTANEAIQNSKLATRDSEECEECGVGCCCCGIELYGGTTEATFSICGVCDGDYACGPYTTSSPCSTVSGYGKDFLLNTMGAGTRAIFCVPEGGSIRILNTSSHTIILHFTCQVDITSPDYETFTLGVHEWAFFFNDGSCFLAGC